MRKRVLSMIVVCAFIATSAWSAFAAQQNTPPPQERGPGRGMNMQGEMVMGAVALVGVDRLEIKRQDGTSQVVMVNDQTRYRQGQQDIQMEDLKAGDHVFVRGTTNDKKEFVALMVRRVTDEEMQRFQGGGQRTGGEIISIEGNQIKLQNPRQGERVVEVNDQTTFMKDGQAITLKDLKAGDRVFVVGKDENGKFVAARVVSGPFRQGGMGRRNPGPDQEKPNE